MTELKWTGKEIITFLNIFRRYPCLWDVSSKDYLNRKVKKNSYNQLLENLVHTEIPGTLESIKKKIKSLRETYRKELQKVQKSIQSGVSANEVYKPKLVWFSAAEVFWHEALAGKEPSNLDKQQYPTHESEYNSSNDANYNTEHTPKWVLSQIKTPETPHLEKPLQSASITPSLLKKRQSSQMLPPQQAKLLKQLPADNKQSLSKFENPINTLQQIAELITANKEDQYDKFAKHISSQLRELPLKSFILLQSKIQNLITEERLASLCTSNSEPLSQSVNVNYQNSTSYQEFEKVYSGSEKTSSKLYNTHLTEKETT